MQVEVVKAKTKVSFAKAKRCKKTKNLEENNFIANLDFSLMCVSLKRLRVYLVVFLKNTFN